jgi:HNH endonuclease
MRNDHIIVENARQLWDYNPETGKIYWKEPKCNGAIKAGQEAGSITTSGYREVRVGRKPVAIHRVIWFLHYGELPECQLDHINRDRSDNRVSNLRVAYNNASDNNQNRAIGRNNTSGYKGVLWSAKLKKWIVRLKLNGRSMYFGAYADIEDAIKARKQAEATYFTFAHAKE